jgi:ubiquitin carboxyl-terminal hydrolase 22/27/51
MDLSLDMQIQAKKRAIENSKSPATTLDLDNCLKGYTASEKLVADAYGCQVCGANQPATKALRLRKLPAILCVQLKVCPVVFFNLIRN